MAATLRLPRWFERAEEFLDEGFEELDEDAARIDYGDATIAFYSALLRLNERHRTHRPAEAAAYWPAVEAAVRRLRAIRDMTTGAGSHADASQR